MIGNFYDFCVVFLPIEVLQTIGNSVRNDWKNPAFRQYLLLVCRHVWKYRSGQHDLVYLIFDKISVVGVRLYSIQIIQWKNQWKDNNYWIHLSSPVNDAMKLLLRTAYYSFQGKDWWAPALRWYRCKERVLPLDGQLQEAARHGWEHLVCVLWT